MPLPLTNSCHIGPPLSGHFIAEHYFLYVASGTVSVHDVEHNHSLQAGEFGIACKNQLARFSEHGAIIKAVVVFDNGFLQKFQEKHLINPGIPEHRSAFIPCNRQDMVEMFVAGLAPYYANGRTLDERFADLKREELLMILLHSNPELTNVLFDPSFPKRANLAAYMEGNYKFNASVEQFAFLTGRSLSGFKRDFQKTFNDTPSHWLVKRRLKEAHFLITQKGERPANIYLELGFEDLSHFSFAFKKMFGSAPSILVKPPSRLRN